MPPPGAPWLQKRPANPNLNIIWLVLGIFTFGLIYPIPAIIAWVRTWRYRSPRVTQPPARAWLIWACVFTVLTVGCYAGLIALGASQNHHHDDTVLPPQKNITVPLGTTVALDAQDSPNDGSGVVPITLTMSNVRHRPHSGVSDVNLTALAKVCSTTASIDPLAAVIVVSLVTDDGTEVDAAADWTLPDAFYENIGPHRCLSGTVGYRLPSGSTAKELVYESFVTDTVSWTVS